MRKVVIFLVAFVFIASGVSFAAKIKYRAFTPTGATKSVTLKSKTSQHKYFVVDKGISFGFDAAGPTRIRIRTRAEMSPDTKNAEYEIQVWEGDHLVDGRKVKSVASPIASDEIKAPIGLARDVIVKVPKGKHTYRLWVISDKTSRIYARFGQEKKPAKKTQYNYYKPYEFTKQVTLVSSKKPVIYYVVDQNGGASLSVVGPTKIQIYCRATFNKSIKGSAKFSLGLFEKGQQAAIFPAVAKASSKIEFKELPEMIPSALNTFVFSVPEGKHVYELKEVDLAAPSLAVRFKIAKVGLGMMP
jgi:hypothetical protein